MNVIVYARIVGVEAEHTYQLAQTDVDGGDLADARLTIGAMLRALAEEFDLGGDGGG